MLLMGCLAACQKPIELGPPPPPPERLTCEKLPTAPSLAALEVVEIAGVRYYLKSAVDLRDSEIAGYIVQVRESWFSCYNDVEWNSIYWEEQE